MKNNVVYPFRASPRWVRIAVNILRRTLLRSTALLATFFETITAYRATDPGSHGTVLQEKSGEAKTLPGVAGEGK